MRPVPEHLRHLPVRDGRPVPWVTVWSEEVKPERAHVWGDETGVHGDRGTVRAFGMTCFQLGNKWQGKGDPYWKGTSSGRQRQCMTAPRCQVCGNRLRDTPTWILPAKIRDTEGENLGEVLGIPGVLTKQPPLCVPCADTVDRWCPHLARRDYDRITAPCTPVAMVVSVVERLVRGNPVWEDGIVRLDDPSRVHCIGRELVVRLESV